MMPVQPAENPNNLSLSKSIAVRISSLVTRYAKNEAVLNMPTQVHLRFITVCKSDDCGVVNLNGFSMLL